MTKLLEAQAGDGPVDGLVEAARGLADAVTDYRSTPTTPPRLVALVDRLAAVLPRAA